MIGLFQVIPLSSSGPISSHEMIWSGMTSVCMDMSTCASQECTPHGAAVPVLLQVPAILPAHSLVHTQLLAVFQGNLVHGTNSIWCIIPCDVGMVSTN